MSSYGRLNPEARRISAALAWQIGQKRLSVLARDSPLRRDPARDAARLLDRCLSELAREEARSRLALGRLLAVFGRRFATTKLGFVRMSDYTRERLGISGSEANVTARVVRRLEELPLLLEAFLAGELSWTKARVLSGVAKADTAARWLALAATRTVRELEKLVTDEGALASREVVAAREDDDVELDGEPRARFRMRMPTWAWLFFRRIVELAQSVAGETMPTWKAVEAINGEGVTAGRDAFSEDVEVELMWLGSRRGKRRTGDTWKPRAALPAEAGVDLLALLPSVGRWLGIEEDELRRLLPDAAAAPEVADAADLTLIELDRRLRAVAASMRTIDVRMGRALRFVSERRLYAEVGFYDFEAYVTERLGIGLRKARSLVALDRLGAKCPALGRAYDDGRISWVRAVVLLPVVREGREVERWVERAAQVPVRRLAEEVSWALERKIVERTPASPPALGARLEPVQMRVNEGEAPLDQMIEFWGPASSRRSNASRSPGASRTSRRGRVSSACSLPWRVSGWPKDANPGSRSMNVGSSSATAIAASSPSAAHAGICTCITSSSARPAAARRTGTGARSARAITCSVSTASTSSRRGAHPTRSSGCSAHSNLSR